MIATEEISDRASAAIATILLMRVPSVQGPPYPKNAARRVQFHVNPRAGGFIIIPKEQIAGMSAAIRITIARSLPDIASLIRRVPFLRLPTLGVGGGAAVPFSA